MALDMIEVSYTGFTIFQPNKAGWKTTAKWQTSIVAFSSTSRLPANRCGKLLGEIESSGVPKFDDIRMRSEAYGE